ncbi:hypothetical protein O9992_26700 [Vibrio lentus]|nr:hypothetical protein [Vibrio lentus]
MHDLTRWYATGSHFLCLPTRLRALLRAALRSLLAFLVVDGGLWIMTVSTQ